MSQFTNKIFTFKVLIYLFFVLYIHMETLYLVGQQDLHSIIDRGSYMSAHVLLNLLNELGKRDKMRGLPSILSLFPKEFNKSNNT